MQSAVDTVQTVAPAAKVATALSHLKNNRIEYLLALLISHFLGLTELLLTHAQGVCA
jgi:hypothetical protein